MTIGTNLTAFLQLCYLPYNCSNAELTWANILGQSPVSLCRNNLILGYHGVPHGLASSPNLEFDNRYQDLTIVRLADFVEERIESEEKSVGIRELAVYCIR